MQARAERRILIPYSQTLLAFDPQSRAVPLYFANDSVYKIYTTKIL
jgi:hypothetical protein